MHKESPSNQTGITLERDQFFEFRSEYCMYLPFPPKDGEHGSYQAFYDVLSFMQDFIVINRSKGTNVFSPYFGEQAMVVRVMLDAIKDGDQLKGDSGYINNIKETDERSFRYRNEEGESLFLEEEWKAFETLRQCFLDAYEADTQMSEKYFMVQEVKLGNKVIPFKKGVIMVAGFENWDIGLVEGRDENGNLVKVDAVHIPANPTEESLYSFMEEHALNLFRVFDLEKMELDSSWQFTFDAKATVKAATKATMLLTQWKQNPKELQRKQILDEVGEMALLGLVVDEVAFLWEIARTITWAKKLNKNDFTDALLDKYSQRVDTAMNRISSRFPFKLLLGEDELKSSATELAFYIEGLNFDAICNSPELCKEVITMLAGSETDKLHAFIEENRVAISQGEYKENEAFLSEIRQLFEIPIKAVFEEGEY